jgi:hypothetical protein
MNLTNDYNIGDEIAYSLNDAVINFYDTFGRNGRE